MNRPSLSGLDALLQRPSTSALAAPLRQALLDAWHQPGTIIEPSQPWPVLADTLDALALLSADEAVIVAALLFDLPGLRVRLSELPLGALAPAVNGLLEGQDAADQVWALHAGRDAGRNSEGLRRLLLSIIHDLRVVPILLARQLACMRAASRLDDGQRRALAQLTRDIHAPLANRLGIWQLKWELEDLAFRFLEPDTYRHIARQVDETRMAREHYVEAVKKKLSAALAEQGIRGEVSGRPKHIYSIWRKMQKKQLAFEQLYDLRAVRVMVDDVGACYAALGVVHALWTPIPSEFDDYIARPKANDYRSLHTAVLGPEGRTIEVQIRTHEMHAQAELGVAAHWKYKEGGKGAEKAFDRKITWMRQLLEQAQDAANPEDLAGALDAELVEDRVYALTPKGEVLDLPAGATPLDFAYQIHTMVGHRCRGAKVNGRIVPLTYRLRSGDRVEILTGKEADPRRDWLLAGLSTELMEDRSYVLTPQGKVIDLPRGGTVLDFAYHVHTEVGHRCVGAKVNGRIVPLTHQPQSGDRVEILTGKEARPRRDWLLAANGYLASGRARDKVRAWFHRIEYARNVQAGREILDRELKRLALGQADIEAVLPRFRMAKLDDLLVALALGDVSPSQVARALHEQAAPPPAPSRPSPAPPSRHGAQDLTIEGIGNVLTTLARCCQPVAGEPIAGYLTRGRGVSIHREGCVALERLAARHPERIVPVEWGRRGARSYSVDVLVRGVDRKYLLKDLTNVIATGNAHVLGVNSRVDQSRGTAELRFALKVSDFDQLGQLLTRMAAVPGVSEARRTT